MHPSVIINGMFRSLGFITVTLRYLVATRADFALLIEWQGGKTLLIVGIAWTAHSNWQALVAEFILVWINTMRN